MVIHGIPNYMDLFVRHEHMCTMKYCAKFPWACMKTLEKP